jgi:lysophospholipase L1-like esterase
MNPRECCGRSSVAPHILKIYDKFSTVIEIDEKDTVEVWDSNVVSKPPAKSTLRQLCRRHIKIIAGLSFVVLIVTIFMLVTCAPTCILGPSYSRPVSLRAIDRPFNLAVLGDSLVTGNHYQKFGIFPIIASKISAFLPNFNLNTVNYGHGGDGVKALHARLKYILGNPKIDGIVILWDSDVSSIDETPDNAAHYRDIYTSEVTALVQDIQLNNSAIRIALAGPILIGEGPLFLSPTAPSYRSKTNMLNEYVVINRQIAIRLNVSYIDIRGDFLSSLPNYRLANWGCLTIDGEHENENGMTIIAKSVAKLLVDWNTV